MKIYTKTGDGGETDLFAGSRVAKNHPRIEAYGCVDELNSCLGVVRTESLTDEIDGVLLRLQNDLFAVGAELATPEPELHGNQLIAQQHIEYLEQQIDFFERQLPPLDTFILPAGGRATCCLHLARTVSRRAERRVADLFLESKPAVSRELLVYLNRLGDLLFVLARSCNAAEGRQDVNWQKPPTT
ncbi:MAG: ATP:cob(I)alamin adenosyltransferase [Planctomycetaceae bacterium]|nr:ATP:cob(I)alamin adenosyltransferase [Planctomycetaceae bacterium]